MTPCRPVSNQTEQENQARRPKKARSKRQAVEESSRGRKDLDFLERICRHSVVLPDGLFGAPDSARLDFPRCFREARLPEGSAGHQLRVAVPEPHLRWAVTTARGTSKPSQTSLTPAPSSVGRVSSSFSNHPFLFCAPPLRACLCSCFAFKLSLSGSLSGWCGVSWPQVTYQAITASAHALGSQGSCATALWRYRLVPDICGRQALRLRASACEVAEVARALAKVFVPGFEAICSVTGALKRCYDATPFQSSNNRVRRQNLRRLGFRIKSDRLLRLTLHSLTCVLIWAKRRRRRCFNVSCNSFAQMARSSWAAARACCCVRMRRGCGMRSSARA
ncbi:hypothetical protein DFH07DRAFT_577060 [Mycena maculata]|uniref:Uncharacterized protein n=1 Tax=Mycena maculata TaxID=230809 RepID=A0AAD7IS64_9AGAR|nr:hypothetical protein DFH07DRAFT_577060 [Mycena maculata]